MGLFSKTPKVILTITSGKQYLNMGIFSSTITMSKDEANHIIFGKLNSKYEILEYNWDGAKYESVTNASKTSTTNVEGKGKEKRTGRVAGAVIGTVLLPGVGTVIGASVGTGKKTKGKSTSSNIGNETVTHKDVEVKSPASLKLRNIDTNDIIVIGFECDSKLDVELQNFNLPASQAEFIQDISTQKSSVQLLKEYKELYDLGVISEEEFLKKKNELL